MLMRTGLAVATIILGMQFARGQETKVNLGRVTWSAFTCATYAEMSGNKTEHGRLFKLGYEAAKKFIEGLREKTIPDEEARLAPMSLMMLLGGPSTDFMVGRIFENAMTDAYDSIAKEDSSGMPLEPTKWVTDAGIQKIIASTMYVEANCELIR